MTIIQFPARGRFLKAKKSDSLPQKTGRNTRTYLEVRDRYGRSVAEVLLKSPSGEQSVQEEMLKAGMAYHYKQYSNNCHNRDVFDSAEALGRSQQRGVWRLSQGDKQMLNYPKPKH